MAERPTALEQERECPFGVEARHCGHQETYAADWAAVMYDDLKFVCKLPKGETCPKIKEALNG